MEFHTSKAFFKSDAIDPFTNLPVYVFDSNYLPDFSGSGLDKKTIEHLIVKAFRKIISRIPKRPYVLTCFTSGFRQFNQNNNSWITGLKCYQLLPDDLKDNMKRVYVVHESWLIRSFTQILQNIVYIKSFKISGTSNIEDDRGFEKVVYCNNLTVLSKFIDITKIRISLDVYLYDAQLEDKLIIPYHVKQDSMDYVDYKQEVYNRVVKILLLEGPRTELVFTKPGNPKKLTILQSAIERANYIDISQWDVYVIASLYLSILKEEPLKLIPVKLIQLPFEDSFDYTLMIFKKMIDYNEQFDLIAQFFEIVFNLLEHSDMTRHDLKSITKAITPALTQEKLSLKNNDKILIGQRFIKNLLTNWDEITRKITSQCDSVPMTPTKAPSLPPRRKEAPQAPPPRKVSFCQLSSVASSISETPKLIHDAPAKRNVSLSSVLSIESDNSDSSLEQLISPTKISKNDGDNESLEPFIIPAKSEKGNNARSKVLMDMTSSLNRAPATPNKRKPNKVATKFSDGYSSIEGQKKVNKLAKLYEERLIGLQIMHDIDS